MNCAIYFSFGLFLLFTLENVIVKAQESSTGFDKAKAKISDKIKEKLKPSLKETKDHLSSIVANRTASKTTTTTASNFFIISEEGLGITLPPDRANATIEVDSHTYYNSTFYPSPTGKPFWHDVDKMPGHKTIVHAMLSNSHRQAATVELSFDFPFYGHVLRNVTIATGGFLYMGTYLHNWIAATQYSAPLMANFDTTLSVNSTIKYADTGDTFSVTWENVIIQERPNDGAFTFQVNLLKSGDIVFVYKNIPYPVANISDAKHPVKVGLSEAYILERSIFFVRRKTVYEYHRIDKLNKVIGDDSAFYFKALPTCLSNKDCVSCQAASPDLECVWCELVQRCSDGIDRHRQEWVKNGCALQGDSGCPAKAPPVPQNTTVRTTNTEDFIIITNAHPKAGTEMTSFSTDVTPSKPDSSSVSSTTYLTRETSHEIPTFSSEKTSDSSDNSITADQLVQDNVKVKATSSSGSISTGAVVTIIIFIAILMAVAGWAVYAYRFPHSTSGQFLIKYRPSQWNFKTSEHTVSSNSLHM